MRRKFRGEHDCKVDGKGRLVIPSQLRPVIQNIDPSYEKGGQATIIVVFGGQRDRNLDCYTVTAADEVQERIDRLERGSALRTVMEYDFNTCSDELTMDDTGRLVRMRFREAGPRPRSSPSVSRESRDATAACR